MSYCRKCGRELPDDSLFCPSCGTKVLPEIPEKPEIQRSVHVTPVSVQVTTKNADTKPKPEFRETLPAPQNTKPKDPPGVPSEISVFVLGIVSIAMSTNGLAGLILSLITRSRIREREQAVGDLTGKARVGKTLATIALPVSIAFLVLISVQAVTSCISGMRVLSELGDSLNQWFRIMLK